MSRETKEKKAQIIDQLQESFANCNIGILTDYRGLTTPEMTKLRRSLREVGVEYRVTKNTLARFAAERANRNALAELFEGPTAVTLGYGDITQPAKALTDYIRTSKLTLDIKGGFMGDRLLTKEEIIALAALPPKEILLAKVIGGMQAPITNLVSRLSSPIQGFINVILARTKKMEEG